MSVTERGTKSLSPIVIFYLPRLALVAFDARSNFFATSGVISKFPSVVRSVTVIFPQRAKRAFALMTRFSSSSSDRV